LSSLLILGAGYLGAALAQAALARGLTVTLADNWYATEPAQLEGLKGRGARVRTADIRDREDLDRLLSDGPERVYLLAAQASRPLADRDPEYTESTNLTGARRVVEAIVAAGTPSLVYASSLHVYGTQVSGVVDTGHPYGAQEDLAHLSKVYAELCLAMYAGRHGFTLSILRLGIVYGPSPVVHARPESQTVVDKFRRLSRAGAPLALDGGGRAVIGTVHVEDAARILLEAPWEPGVAAANVAADTVTVADVAALARGEPAAGRAGATFASPFSYRHRLAGYLAG
jgi:UDP-glucose 4-epimerase